MKSDGLCWTTCNDDYKYTCDGDGYTGGVGNTCNRLYNACTCVDGYEWKDGSCQKQVQNGAQGDLYYCNGTVVAVKTPEMNFYIAMQDLGYMGEPSAVDKSLDYIFCSNLTGSLPSVDQLRIMYSYKSSLNNLLLTNGGTNLTEGSYWSSITDFTYDDYGNYTYTVSLYDGLVGSGYFADSNYVRPILTSW